MNPQNKQNMISLIAARSSPVVGGQQLIDLHFPPGALVDGVGQVHARINANQDISTAKTLLGQLGSTVSFGNLLVVPLANSLLYVEPMIVQAQSNAVPLLEYVIHRHLHQGRVQYDAAGLAQPARGSTGTADDADGNGLQLAHHAGDHHDPGRERLGPEPRQQALQHLQNYQQAEGKGDFATAGQELAALAKVAPWRRLAQPHPFVLAQPDPLAVQELSPGGSGEDGSKGEVGLLSRVCARATQPRPSAAVRPSVITC